METIVLAIITLLLIDSAFIILFKLNETVGFLFVAILIVSLFQMNQPENVSSRARQALHTWLVDSSIPTIFTFCSQTANEDGYTECIYMTAKNSAVKVNCYSTFHYIFNKTMPCIAQTEIVTENPLKGLKEN